MAPTNQLAELSVDQAPAASGSRLGWGPFAAAGLLLANILAPIVWGDVYPFTSAPMFRDSPRVCCNYRVLGPDGQQLESHTWLCHRLYDGNPLGYGVGIEPPKILEQQFGHVHDQTEVTTHIRAILERLEHAHLPFVDVVQDVIGPQGEAVGVVESRRWRVTRSP
jgi:hypothetical protein